MTQEVLDDITVEVMKELAGEHYARNFLRWRQIGKLDVPLVVLMGGATGVGKSTIATQLAVRLGIVRVVATDMIREVMRALFTNELMPTLYTSSFDADSALREPPARPMDRVIVGFREQTSAVAVGISAIMKRAALEGISMVIEGTHVVPGFFDPTPYEGKVLALPVVLFLEDEDLHRSHLVARSANSASRPFERYMRGFSNIRRVQKYIKSQALEHGVDIIPSYNLDQALARIIDLVIERSAEAARNRGPNGLGPRHRAKDATQLEASKR